MPSKQWQKTAKEVKWGEGGGDVADARVMDDADQLLTQFT